jgi:hypothetical protein
MTLPASLGSLLLLFFGCGFLWVAYRARRTGELPAGSRGLRPFRPRRSENPAAFYFFQALYVIFGLGLALYAVLMAIGRVPPLPLR